MGEAKISSRALFALSPWLAITGLAAWLLRPALTPVHVEGFSASIVALGLHLARHSAPDFMPFAPFNADYFGLTKLGAVLGVAAMAPLLGADGAMRLITIGGLVLVFAASADLIRRWSGARWSVVAVVLLLMPGVAESGFFYNDNVPAAALMLTALALLARWPSWPAAIPVGVLIGCAVAVRTDTALLAVMATPFIAKDGQRFGRAALVTGVAGLVAVLVVFAVFAAVHASPLDAIHAGALAARLWDRPSSILSHLLQFLFFCGVPAFLLLAIGLSQLRAERQWWRLALLCTPPLFFNLILLGMMWEARQFLALAPFLGALAAVGAEALIAELRAGRRAPPLLVATFTALILILPVKGLILTDGPRSLTGRLANVLLWSNWQGQVRRDFATIDELVARAPDGAVMVVLTDGWNDDRYLHLQLLERGFQRVMLPASCDKLGEGMRRRGRTVVQLTLRQSFVTDYWPALMPERLESGALPCIGAVRPSEVVLLAQQDRIKTLLDLDLSGRGLSPALRATGMNEVAAVPLDERRMAALDASYRRQAMPFGARRRGASAIDAALASHSPFSR